MIYVLFLIFFLALTLKWVFWSLLMFIIHFKIPLDDAKKEFRELYYMIKAYTYK